MQIVSGLRESDDSTAALIDLFQHLLDRGLLGQAPQFTSEVLLQRLPAPLGATLKRSVHIIGNIANEHIHAYKMLSRGHAARAHRPGTWAASVFFGSRSGSGFIRAMCRLLIT